jgi:hypothetical protein
VRKILLKNCVKKLIFVTKTASQATTIGHRIAEKFKDAELIEVCFLFPQPQRPAARAGRL